MRRVDEIFPGGGGRGALCCQHLTYGERVQSVCHANPRGHRGPPWVSLEDIHVTMGVQGMKGCCVFYVCVLTSVERLFNCEKSNFKKHFKKLF